MLVKLLTAHSAGSPGVKLHVGVFILNAAPRSAAVQSAALLISAGLVCRLQLQAHLSVYVTKTDINDLNSFILFHTNY